MVSISCLNECSNYYLHYSIIVIQTPYLCKYYYINRKQIGRLPLYQRDYIAPSKSVCKRRELVL